MGRAGVRAAVATLPWCGDGEVDSLVLALLQRASHRRLQAGSLAAIIGAWGRMSADARTTALAHDYLPWSSVAGTMLAVDSAAMVSDAAEFAAKAARVDLVVALLARGADAGPVGSIGGRGGKDETSEAKALRAVLTRMPEYAARAVCASAARESAGLGELGEVVNVTLAPQVAGAAGEASVFLTALARESSTPMLGKLLGAWARARRAPCDKDEAAAVARCETSYMAARSVLRRGAGPVAIKLAVSVLGCPTLARAASDRLIQGSLGLISKPVKGASQSTSKSADKDGAGADVPVETEAECLRSQIHLLLSPRRKAALGAALVEFGAKQGQPGRAGLVPSIVTAITGAEGGSEAGAGAAIGIGAGCGADAIDRPHRSAVLLALRHLPMRTPVRQGLIAKAGIDGDPLVRCGAAVLGAMEATSPAVLYDLAFDAHEPTARLAASTLLTGPGMYVSELEELTGQLHDRLRRSSHESVRVIAESTVVITRRVRAAPSLAIATSTAGVAKAAMVIHETHATAMAGQGRALLGLEELSERQVIDRLIELRTTPVTARQVGELCGFVRRGHDMICYADGAVDAGGAAGPYTARAVAAALPSLARSGEAEALELLNEIVASPWARIRSTAIEALFAAERLRRAHVPKAAGEPLSGELSATLLAGTYDDHHRVATSSLRALLTVTRPGSPAAEQLIDRATVLLTCESDMHTLASLWLIERKLDRFAGYESLIAAIDGLAEGHADDDDDGERDGAADVGELSTADRCVARAVRVSRAFASLREGGGRSERETVRAIAA